MSMEIKSPTKILAVIDCNVKGIKAKGKIESEITLGSAKKILGKGDVEDIQTLFGESVTVYVCEMGHELTQADLDKGKNGRLFTSTGGVVENVRNDDGEPITAESLPQETPETPEEITPDCWCQVCKNYKLGESEEGIIEWACKFLQRWLPCEKCDGIKCPGDSGGKCPRFDFDQEKFDELGKQELEDQPESAFSEDNTEEITKNEGLNPEDATEEDGGEVPDTSEIDEEIENQDIPDGAN